MKCCLKIIWETLQIHPNPLSLPLQTPSETVFGAVFGSLFTPFQRLEHLAPGFKKSSQSVFSSIVFLIFEIRKSLFEMAEENVPWVEIRCPRGANGWSPHQTSGKSVLQSSLWGCVDLMESMVISWEIYGHGDFKVISWENLWWFLGISWDENPMEYDGHTEIYPLNPSGHFKDGEWKSLTCRKNHRTLGWWKLSHGTGNKHLDPPGLYPKPWTCYLIP